LRRQPVQAVKGASIVLVSLFVSLLASACGWSPAPPEAVASPPASPSAAVASPAATPIGDPSPVASLPTSNLPAFQCSDQAGNGWPGPGTARAITSVRVGAQSGYDRFVIEFSGPSVPGYRG